MDYLCLYISAKILKRAFSLKRMLLASLLGGLYSVASLFLPISTAVSFACDILTCFIMAAIAFHAKKQFKSTIISGALFFGVSMALGGIMTALYNLLNKLDLPLGSIEGDSLSVWGFAIIAILAACMSLFGGEIIFRKKEIKQSTLTIYFDGKELSLRALTDSGNLVRDAVSGKPVIFIDSQAAKGFVDQNILDDFLKGTPSKNPAYSGMRVTPINTLSGKQMLVLLRAEKIIISYSRKNKIESFSPDAMFALGDIGKSAEECDAIIPYSLFRG